MMERILPSWQFGMSLFSASKNGNISSDWSEKASAFVPGGANGVLFKLNSPLRRAYANNFGFVRDDRSRLMLITACCNSSHQSCIGKSLLMVHRPETK